MKRFARITVLCIFMLLLSFLVFGQEPDEFTAETFSQNPDAFDQLSPEKQIEFLNENYELVYNKNPELVHKFYSNANNVGKSPVADAKYFGNPDNIGRNIVAQDMFFSSAYGGQKIELVSFLTEDPDNKHKEAAAKYFSVKFSAPYNFEKVNPDFKYDAAQGKLTNGGKEITLNQFSNDATVKGIVAVADGFKIIRQEKDKPEQEILVEGDGTSSIVYDSAKKEISFKDANGKKQKFTIAGDKTSFEFLQDGSLRITGDVSGAILHDQHRFVKFDNFDGTLTISKNGDIEADNAIVETEKFYLDGKFKYSKADNKVEAWDHGNERHDGYTVIVDKDSEVGVKSQGQIQGQHTLTVHFDKQAKWSAFSPDPAAKPPASVPDLIQQAQSVPPPKLNICGTGGASDCSADDKNAEVFIKRVEPPGFITVSSKGPADVGFYRLASTTVGSSAVAVDETKPHFIGKNGLSELDTMVGMPQTQINIRGQAEYTDNQYARFAGTKVNDGIFTRQDGSSVRIIRNSGEFEDEIFSGCHQLGAGICEPGSIAVDVKKTLAFGTKTEEGVFTNPDYASLTLSAKVTKEGLEYNWKEFLSGLGEAAQKQAEGQELVLGRSIIMKNTVCEGTKQCNLLLTDDKGVATAYYEVYDPETNTVSKPVPIRTFGKSVGEATVLTSAANIERVEQLRTLMETGQYAQISAFFKKDPFEKDPQLRDLILREAGIDIDNLGNDVYVNRLGNVVRRHAEAQSAIQQLGQKYGIKLDESGRALTVDDQQRLHEIMIKGGKRSGDDSVIFDLYTRARLALAQAEAEDKAALYQACAGSVSCPVTDKDWKEAQKKAVAELKTREASPEYKAWDKARVREELERRIRELKFKRYVDKALWVFSDDHGQDVRDAQGILQKHPGKNALKDALQKKKDELAGLEKKEKELLAKFEKREVGGGEIRNLQLEIGILEGEVSGLESEVTEVTEAETKKKSALASLTSLVAECPDVLCKAELLNQAGFTKDATDLILGSDALPEDIKDDLIEDYLGADAQQKLAELNKIPQEFENNKAAISKLFKEKEADLTKGYQQGGGAREEALSVAELALLPADRDALKASLAAGDENKVQELLGKASTELNKNYRLSKVKDVFRTSVAIRFETDDPYATSAESLRQQLDQAAAAGDEITVLAILKEVNDRYKQTRVISITSFKDATRSSQDYLKATGDRAGAAALLNQVPLDLQETPEYTVAKQRIEETYKEKVRQLVEDQRNREWEEVKKRDGITSGTVPNNWHDAATEAAWAGLGWVGGKLETGGFYVIGGAFSAAGVVSPWAAEVGEGFLSYEDRQKERIRENAAHFEGEAAKFASCIHISRSECAQKFGGRLPTPLANLDKQMRGEQLNHEDLAQELLWNRQNDVVQHGGDYEYSGRYAVSMQDIAGQYPETSAGKYAQQYEKEAEEVDGLFLTRRQTAQYGDMALRFFASVDNFIPGVAVEKLAVLGAKAAKGAGVVRALDKIHDVSKLALATEKTGEAFKTARTALREAEALEAAGKVSKLADAQQNFKVAQKLVDAELAQSGLGRAFARNYYLGVTRKTDDLVELEHVRRNVLDKVAQTTDGIEEAKAAGRATEPLEKARTALVQKVDDLDKTERAIQTVSGSDWVTETGLRTATPTQLRVIPGPAYNKAREAVEDLGKAREAFLAERTAKGAARVNPETVDNLFQAAEAAEEATWTNRVGTALRGELNGARAARSVGKVETTKVSALTDPEIDQLGKNLDTLLENGADLKTAEGKITVDLEDIAEDTRRAFEAEGKVVGQSYYPSLDEVAEHTQQLLGKTDSAKIVDDVNTERVAEVLSAANDERTAARNLVDDLGRKANGEASTGIVPEVTRTEARIPSSQGSTIATNGDAIVPPSVESRLRSTAGNTNSITPIVEEGKTFESAVDKLPESIVTREQNRQRVAELLPEVGEEVRVTTVNGNELTGPVLLKDEGVVFVEKFNEPEKVRLSAVVDVEKPKVDLEKITELEARGAKSNLVEPCSLAAAAIYGLAPCVPTEAITTEAPAPQVEEIPEETLPELENAVHLDAENAPTPFQRQIEEGRNLERLLDEAPLSDELYQKATLDSHGAQKLPVFENNLPPRYTLYEISMDRSTVKSLNDVSYELGTNAISSQHMELISFAEQNGLPVTTLQKTTYIAVPEGSVTSIDDVLAVVENARSATSQVTKQPIKLRVGAADSADTLMETRLRTKRSLEFAEQNKVSPTKYGDKVKDWYGQLPVEQKANVNDIFAGYDEALKDEFADLNKLRAEGKTEEYQQKLAQLATAEVQDAKFSNLPVVKKYQSDPITGIKEGDAVVSTDGIALGQQNKEDVLDLTRQNLPDDQLAGRLGRNIDNSIVQVNEKIKETYFKAVDNVNLQPAEVIGKYDDIARAAKYPGGSVTNTDELKDFLKWEFEHRGRFRGGDETFMTLRQEVLEANPDFAETLQQAIHLCETCDYGVRVGFKEVGTGENYAQAISAADQAVIASKKSKNVPVVVDRFGNVKPLEEARLQAAVSDVVEPCAVTGGAIVGLASCPGQIVLTSSISKDNSLVRLAEDAAVDQSVQRGLDHLTGEISKGNFVGRVRHLEGTDVFYLGHDSGARVYYRQIGPNQYEIVAKSAKGRNQDQVINRLQKLYSRCSITAAAVYGLAGCAQISEPILLERISDSEISGIKTKFTLTDPNDLKVTGQDKWNNLIDTVKKSEGEVSLPKADLETILNDPDILGLGAEGVVQRVPEEVRLALGIDKPAVIKVLNYNRPDLEEIVNTFPESAQLLDELKGKEVAPEIYLHGKNYYVVEEIDGENIHDVMFRELTPEQQDLYRHFALNKQYDKTEKLLQQAFTADQKQELRTYLDELTTKLAEEGIVVDDFHPENVMLVDTEEGRKAKVVDMGFAYKTDPERAKVIYQTKTNKLIDGGGYQSESNLREIRKVQRGTRTLEEIVGPIFETSTGKYVYDSRKGKWIQPREGLVGKILGDKEADDVTTFLLNKAREKAGLPKAKPAVIQKGDLFEIAGEDYYLDRGVWKQKRTLWFDKEVDDAEVIRELDVAKIDSLTGKETSSGSLTQATVAE